MDRVAGGGGGRRGSLNLDMVAALSVLALIGTTLALVTTKRRDLVALERRSAGLETAQNLLAVLRTGGEPELPDGWTVRREGSGDETAVLVLQGPDALELRVLVPVEVP